MNFDTTTTPIDKLLPRLEGLRESGPRRWMARCPAHDDARPSLSVREGEDAVLLIKCFGGCGAGDIVSALGLELRDLFPPSAESWSRPQKQGSSTTMHSTPKRRRAAPRIPASDALDVLDLEAWVVEIIAGKLQGGAEITEGMVRDLEDAARRIHAVRTSWSLP